MSLCTIVARKKLKQRKYGRAELKISKMALNVDLMREAQSASVISWVEDQHKEWLQLQCCLLNTVLQTYCDVSVLGEVLKIWVEIYALELAQILFFKGGDTFATIAASLVATMVSTEAGIFGDVIGGLGKALEKKGHLVEIVPPKYDYAI